MFPETEILERLKQDMRGLRSLLLLILATLTVAGTVLGSLMVLLYQLKPNL